jgi:uncharacterized membrane protein YedE/YeeE
MTAPFLDGAESPIATLSAALVIGLAFGIALEQAGLGSARKLAGLFYLRDFTVFKVMFSAILTAMLGVFWLDRIGFLDASRLYIPETFLLPQLAGGVVFGIGFVLAGLCPGTSCVAAATGRLDGVAVVLGMFSGVLLTGFAFTPIEAFYQSTARGALTLPAITGLPQGVVILAIVAAAIVAFRWIARFEGRKADASRSLH